MNGFDTENRQEKIYVNGIGEGIDVRALLGRDVISVENAAVFDYIQGKSVLVTGGGGSIGAEICRQIAAHKPKQLIIFEIYENNAFQIQMELLSLFPKLQVTVLIGSIRDSRRLNQVFETCRPDIVFHAAAHKHVPLMEESPCEAVKNNVIGTYKTAYAAMAYGTPKFVLISTDKAVNPANVMGATKRICEMVIQTMDYYIRAGRAEEIQALFCHPMQEKPEAVSFPCGKPCTEFVAVRFGNVLGSNGSVVPLFLSQIMQGGPVTVTHPDIIRYFMTISEAVSLVLQASVYAKGGEIFVLDMGEPVKIDTLARNLIRYMGHVPDQDIKIIYTGLRPGEKLYEEKLMKEEGLKTTENHLIYIARPLEFERERFLNQLKTLMLFAYQNDPSIRELLMGIVKEGISSPSGSADDGACGE